MNDPQSLVERRKDNFDLRPALEFVSRHIGQYQASLLNLTSGQPSVPPNFSKIECADPAMCLNCDRLDSQPQITPTDIRKILPHIPVIFHTLSQLEKIDYVDNRIVPVPVFDTDGSWRDVEFVSVDSFPRPSDHPSRILIGRSDGHIIYPSALPMIVWGDNQCRWFYQLHVFLHEFFHTIEYLRRSKKLREKIVLESEQGKRFTFQAWWSQWEDEFCPTTKPPFATRYAATYANSLNWDAFEKQPDVFTRALAEQICESFASYILGIAPNDQDNPDFKSHSPAAWRLMHELAQARVLEL